MWIVVEKTGASGYLKWVQYYEFAFGSFSVSRNEQHKP